MRHDDHRLLTADEEIDLAMRIEAGQDAAQRIAVGDDVLCLTALVEDGRAARDDLILYNLRLVHAVTRKYYTGDITFSYDDLVQEGMMGLMTAADRFDWRAGQRFSTFAVWWIRSFVSKARNKSGTIRMPINDVPAKQSIMLARENARYISSLDDPLPSLKGSEDRTLMDVLSDHRANTENEALDKITVERLLRTPMPERWRAILLDWMDGYSQAEAGARHGLSKGIVYLALERLREAVNE